MRSVGIVAFGGFESAQAANSVCPLVGEGPHCERAPLCITHKVRNVFAANSERPGQPDSTARIFPAFGARDETFALSLFPGSLARSSDGFRLLAGLALRRFFMRLATLHLTKNALALHRGMDADRGGGEIKRPPAGEADWPR